MLQLVLEDTPLTLLIILLLLNGGLLVTFSEVCVSNSAAQNTSLLLQCCCRTINNASAASATSTSIPTSTRARAPAMAADCSEILDAVSTSVPSRYITHRSGGSSSPALSNAQPKSGPPPVAETGGAGLKSLYLQED